MSNTGTVRISLEVDDKGTVKIRQFSGELDKLGKTGKTSFSQVQSGAQATLSTLMKFGGAVMGIMAVRAAIDNLVAAGHEWVDLDEVQEKAETRLQAVLMSTGHAAGFNLDQLKAMASGMQNVTTVGDEVILSGMSILATFKNVRQEAFERATMAALDMSEVMGQDLKSSMVQLGKALNDPVQGITALTRVGVSFTEEQKEMVQTLVESGDIMAAQNIILQELESEFGGAAKAVAQDFEGAVTQAGNALGDLKEELGFVITKNQFFIELAHMATQAFAEWGGKIQDNRQYLMELTKDGVLWLTDALTGAIKAIQFFHLGWLNLKLAAETVVHVIAEGLFYDLKILRMFIKPLELIYDGMVKIGMLDYNPITGALDSMEQGLRTFAKSSDEVAQDTANDILKVQHEYDKVIGTLETMRGKIASIPVTQVKADKAIVKSNAKAQKSILKSNDKTHKKTLKQIEAEKKAREKAEKEKQRILEDFNEKYQRLILGQYEFEREQIRLQAEAYIKAGADKIKVRDWMRAEIAKISDKELGNYLENLDKQTDALENAIEDEIDARLKAGDDVVNIQNDVLREIETIYDQELDAATEKINEIADERLAAGENAVDVEQWRQSEIKKVEDAITVKKEVELEKQTKKLKEEYRKQVLASDDFFAGMKLGWEDLTEHQRTWAQTGYDIVKDFSSNASSTVSDILFDTVTNDMKDLEDYWESFWNSMLKTMTDYVAQMAVEWATSQLVEYGGSFLSNLLTFHTGLVELEDDELLAVLQQGEMVIPAKQAQAIREALGIGGYSTDSFFNAVQDAVSLGAHIQSTGYFSPTMSADVAGIVAGNLVSNSIAGALTAYANYNSIMTQAQTLAKSFNIDMALAKEFAMKQAIATGLSRGYIGFVGEMIGDLGMYGLGIANENISIPGFPEISIPTVANILSSAAALSLGLGVATYGVGAALSPMVGLAVSGIADFLGIRSNEVLRDRLEDDFGEIGGRQVAQALGSTFGVTINEMAYDETAGWYEMVTPADNIVLTKEQIQGLFQQSLQDRIDTMAHTLGFEFTQAIWDAGTETAKDALAQAVKNDWGYFGYDSREKALGQLGISPKYASSAAKESSYSAAIDKANKQELEDAYQHSTYGGFSISHQSAYEASGWGSSHEGGGGWGGPAETGGGTPGHEPGGQFGMATGGLIDRLVVPQGEDGWIATQFGEFVVNRKGVEFLDKINRGEWPGFPGGQQPVVNLTVQIVSQDGQVLEEHFFESLQTASENGRAVVHARGVYTEV